MNTFRYQRLESNNIIYTILMNDILLNEDFWYFILKLTLLLFEKINKCMTSSSLTSFGEIIMQATVVQTVRVSSRVAGGGVRYRVSGCTTNLWSACCV